MLFAGPYFFPLVKLAGEVSFKSDSFLLKLFFRLRVALKTSNFSFMLNFCMSRNKSGAIRKLLRGGRGQTTT